MNRIISTFAATFLYGSLISTANARIESILTLDLVCYYQKSFNPSQDDTTGEVGSLRIDSKDFIAMISEQTDIDYPRGSQLRVNVNGRVTITNSEGTILGNVSQYIKADFDQGRRLFAGKVDTDTGEENSTRYFQFTYTINLPGVQGVVRGIAAEDTNVNQPSDDGIQTTTTLCQEAKIDGKGRFNGSPAFFIGDITMEGRKITLN